MQYRTLGNSDLRVSAVGLGTWAYGNDTFGEVEDQQSIKAIRAAVDSGISLIDTAPAYGAGHSEKVVGRAIKGIKDEVVIATKCGVYRDGSDYVIDLSPELVMGATRLPYIHKDPADRFIIATALTHNSPVVSADRRFAEYGIQLLL